MSISAMTVIEILRDDLFVDVSDVDERTPLFSRGIIDSFTLVGLINEVERRGGFRIAPLDITLDNFDSIERIVRYASLQSPDAQRAAPASRLAAAKG